MNTTILQVPIKKSLRDQAASQAEKMGFSSLQDIVRLFLNKIAAGEMEVKMEPVVKLSAKNEKRYNKMIEEIESGKAKLVSFDSTKSIMDYLNGEN